MVALNQSISQSKENTLGLQNKFWAFVFTIPIVFDNFLIATLSIPTFGLLKHVVVLLLFFYIVTVRVSAGRLSKSLAIAIVWLVFLVLISWLGPSTTGIVSAVAAPILFSKVLFIFVIMSTVRITDNEWLIDVISAVHLLGVLLSIIFINDFINLRGVDKYYGESRILGFQLNANSMAFLSALLGLYYLFFKRNFVLVVVFTLILFGSRSVSGMLFFTSSAFYLALLDGTLRGKMIILFSCALVGVASIILSDRIFETLGYARDALFYDGLYVRAAMMSGGWQLALEHFPIGSGGGTFGSPLGSLEAGGRSTYQFVNIDHLPAVIDGRGIHDSGIGSLLGEYGFIGCAVVLLMVVSLTRGFSRNILKLSDVAFLLSQIVVLSFFRGIVSSYYYSLMMALLLIFVLAIRIKKSNPKYVKKTC